MPHNGLGLKGLIAVELKWETATSLQRPIAYGCSVSTPEGIVCMGGNDQSTVFDDVFLLSWNPETQELKQTIYPSLPKPCAYGQAVLIDNTIYLAGGQSDLGIETAMNNFWSLDLSERDNPEAFQWKVRTPWPSEERAFNLTVAQHNGFHDCVYVMSGRRQDANALEYLTDVWEYTPHTDQWRERSSLPHAMMAGTAIGVGQSHIAVLGGDDGELFTRADELKQNHPGFKKQTLLYHTITDTWTPGGESPANQVTTVPVSWNGKTIIASGEVRPRVRTPAVWMIEPIERSRAFRSIDYVILFTYLMLMVGVGAWFARSNQSTDDYFRGGKHIPWWAAGCSIFATMLSSLTFTGIPSKAFAQDWVYATGNMMIPVVAFFAVYVALPFFRVLDVTSAYEYLERRFHYAVKLFGSLSFTLFHLFRMAVVMSLTGLALAVATPLTPTQSVLLMGILSIAYCTMGGIEAVIWTDTIQTVVLLGGAVFALSLLMTGIGDDISASISTAALNEKFRLANLHWDMTEAQLAIWVVLLGGIGQNISSYTADQAVVQRYMTSETQAKAARSIWTNAVLTIPATFLFFSIGTGLYLFYRSHPERLDMTITTDQVFPMFIATEMPAGVSGLIVAGIFSAAQSTVSTSMNSMTTTIVTDIVRPLNLCSSEKAYLNTARVLTAFIGIAGTLIALLFISPEIRSLFDTFMKVIGLLMGVLGGLFLLGIGTKRANTTGALTGAFIGTICMLCTWQLTSINGYLYTALGIVSCFVTGYAVSLLTPPPKHDLKGLTLHTRTGK